MTEVLKALQELKVYWKKIGHYNMKCRWAPGHREGNSMHGTNYFGDESAIVENEANTATPNVVKFEVQVTNFDRASHHHSYGFSIHINSSV